MKCKYDRQHKKHYNENKIKNVLSKFSNTTYIGTIVHNDTILVLFNYYAYTLAIHYKDFCFDIVNEKIKTLQSKL